MRGPEGNKIIITSFPRDESLRLCRNQPDSSSWRHERFCGNLYEWQRHGPGTSHSHPCDFVSSVGAARKVSPNWSQETMTCHSSDGFSIVWGQGNAPLVTSLPSSCALHDPNIVAVRLAERAWYTKSQSSLWIFNSVSVGSSHSSPVLTKSVWNQSWLSDMWRRFSFKVGAVQLGSVTQMAPRTPFLCVKRLKVCLWWKVYLAYPASLLMCRHNSYLL